MKDEGKRNVVGVMIDALDYEAAVKRVIDAARDGRPYSVSALAVHGVMTGRNRTHRYRLNRLDLATPDGQPVRWALNLMYGTKLRDRVYGPSLTLKLCEAASAEGLPIYLYGGTPDVVATMAANLEDRFPGLKVAGTQASRFRQTTAAEKDEIAEEIRGSGARLTFVGLGCPRQETFAFEYRDALGMPVIAVGAAFDYIAGVKSEPPALLQRLGLQWLYRLLQDPRRLWKRYLLLNTGYVALVTLQALKLWRPDPTDASRPSGELLYG